MFKLTKGTSARFLTKRIKRTNDPSFNCYCNPIGLQPRFSIDPPAPIWENSYIISYFKVLIPVIALGKMCCSKNASVLGGRLVYVPGKMYL